MRDVSIFFLLILIGCIIASCDIVNDPEYKAELLEVEQRNVRINEQKNQCTAQGGQVQDVYGNDLCWKDGKVILVINGDAS